MTISLLKTCNHLNASILKEGLTTLKKHIKDINHDELPVFVLMYANEDAQNILGDDPAFDNSLE